MKIRVLEMHNSIGANKLDLVEKVETFNYFVKLQDSLDKCFKSIENYKKIERITEEDSFDLLEDTEKLLTVDRAKLDRFQDGFYASTPSYRRRVETCQRYLGSICELIEDKTSIYLPYTSEEVDSLERWLKEALGNLTCFVYYQYELDLILAQDEVIEINDVQNRYIEQEGKDVEWLKSFANYTRELLDSCKPNIGILERYPELIEPLERVVGASLYDCRVLQLNTIMDVLNGKITIDEFQEILEKEMAENEDV